MLGMKTIPQCSHCGGHQPGCVNFEVTPLPLGETCLCRRAHGEDSDYESVNDGMGDCLYFLAKIHKYPDDVLLN